MFTTRQVSLTLSNPVRFGLARYGKSRTRLMAAWNMPSSPSKRHQPESERIPMELHGLDTEERVCFYEQDFYVLSNFSSFRVRVGEHLTFDTLEAAYHYYKFKIDGDDEFNESRRHIRSAIRRADSAHDAFKIAERNKAERRPDWDAVKVDIMRRLLHFKVQQHEYVRRKLLATGERELVENSWRDDFWGWGQNRDGQNMLGKLWMEVRQELRAQQAA
jgi:ribA/ribD-fused uncharacterized protein